MWIIMNVRKRPTYSQPIKEPNSHARASYGTDHNYSGWTLDAISLTWCVFQDRIKASLRKCCFIYAPVKRPCLMLGLGEMLRYLESLWGPTSSHFTCEFDGTLKEVDLVCTVSWPTVLSDTVFSCVFSQSFLIFYCFTTNHNSHGNF